MIYSFYRFEQNQNRQWKGGAVKRWVFKFKVNVSRKLLETEIEEIIEDEVDDGKQNPGRWRVMGSLPGKRNLLYGPFEVD